METIRESKNFEGRMLAKREIVEIRWKYIYIYISLLTTRNRHVRQAAGNVMRAQRSKIEEICLK